MAVGGAAGVRMPSTSAAPGAVEAWGRKAVAASRRGGPGASVRCSSSSSVGAAGPAAAAEDPYRTLRLRPGATRGEVKKAYRRLTLMYHPDVCWQRDAADCAVDFQRINVAYQTLMSNMREAEERLEYWRLKYGLSEQDLDRYRHYVYDHHHDDEWLDV